MNQGGLNLKDKVIEEDINNWLNEHPEATTTVQDDSIGITKFTDETRKMIIKDYVTPQMFGAFGDGEHDDTDAFNKAILSDTDIIYIPSGTYCVRKISLMDKKKIIGEDFKNTIIKITGNDYGVELNEGIVSGTVLKNIAIVNEGNASVGLFLVSRKNTDNVGGLWDSHIKNVRVINFSYGMIFAGGLKQINDDSTIDTPNQYDNIEKLYIDNYTEMGAWFCGRCDCLRISDSILGKTLLDAYSSAPNGFQKADVTGPIIFENTQFGQIIDGVGLDIIRSTAIFNNCQSEGVSKAIKISISSNVAFNRYLFERCGISNASDGYLINIDDSGSKVVLNGYRINGKKPNNQFIGFGKNNIVGIYRNHYIDDVSNTGETFTIASVADNVLTTTNKFILCNNSEVINKIVSNFSVGDIIFIRSSNQDGIVFHNVNNVGAEINVPQYGYVALIYSGLKWYPIGGKCTIN